MPNLARSTLRRRKVYSPTPSGQIMSGTPGKSTNSYITLPFWTQWIDVRLVASLKSAIGHAFRPISLNFIFGTLSTHAASYLLIRLDFPQFVRPITATLTVFCSSTGTRKSKCRMVAIFCSCQSLRNSSVSFTCRYGSYFLYRSMMLLPVSSSYL